MLENSFSIRLALDFQCYKFDMRSKILGISISEGTHGSFSLHTWFVVRGRTEIVEAAEIDVDNDED